MTLPDHFYCANHRRIAETADPAHSVCRGRARYLLILAIEALENMSLDLVTNQELRDIAKWIREADRILGE